MSQTTLPYVFVGGSVAALSSTGTSELNSSQYDDAVLPQSTPTPSSNASTSVSRGKSKGRARGRKAWVYKYMRDSVDVQHVFLSTDGKPEWRCQFCLQSYELSGGTLNPKLHLNREHGIFEDSPAEQRVKNVQLSIAAAMDNAGNNPFKRRKLETVTESTAATKLDGNTIEVLYTRFIVSCNQPLRLAESLEFRAFLTYLNADINTWLAASHTTVAIWVQRQYQIEKKQKTQRVQSARSKIHISTDVWTSPNNKPIMVIIAHYISEDNILENAVLDLVEIEGAHEGATLATAILKVLGEWGIMSKLGFFITDNASNNDTMMEKISIGKSYSY